MIWRRRRVGVPLSLTFGVFRDGVYHVHVSVEWASCLLKAIRTIISESWKINAFLGHSVTDVPRIRGTCSVRVYCVRASKLHGDTYEPASFFEAIIISSYVFPEVFDVIRLSCFRIYHIHATRIGKGYACA